MRFLSFLVFYIHSFFPFLCSLGTIDNNTLHCPLFHVLSCPIHENIFPQMVSHHKQKGEIWCTSMVVKLFLLECPMLNPAEIPANTFRPPSLRKHQHDKEYNAGHPQCRRKKKKIRFYCTVARRVESSIGKKKKRRNKGGGGRKSLYVQTSRYMRVHCFVRKRVKSFI